MIPDLNSKANNEKYFKSIRYFSHSLKGEKRRYFITQVAEHNIYLAAQCIMSAEKDAELENGLIDKAQIIAQNFLQPENSAKGFLALAEFSNYEIISKLFLNIKNLSNAHFAVMDIILSLKNTDLFLSFLSIFVETDNFILLKYSIKAFDGEVYVDFKNGQIIKNIIEYLLIKNKVTELHFFIDNFNLYPYLSLCGLDIKKFISDHENVIPYIILAYNFAKYYSLLQEFPAIHFLDNLSLRRGKKALLFSIRIAIENNIKNHKQLNFAIFRGIKFGELKVKKFLYEDIENYNKYIENNIYLISKGITKIEHSYEKTDEKSFIQANKIQSYEIIDNADTIEQEIENLLTKNKNRILVDREFTTLLDKWSISLMEISHLLRVYEFEGLVRRIMEYGCYIKPKTFRTEKLLFLHKDQITTKQEINHPNEVLKEGDLISFRIIGINQQNYRLNISCLDRFKPLNNEIKIDE